MRRGKRSFVLRRIIVLYTWNYQLIAWARLSESVGIEGRKRRAMDASSLKEGQAGKSSIISRGHNQGSTHAFSLFLFFLCFTLASFSFFFSLFFSPQILVWKRSDCHVKPGRGVGKKSGEGDSDGR